MEGASVLWRFVDRETAIQWATRIVVTVSCIYTLTWIGRCAWSLMREVALFTGTWLVATLVVDFLEVELGLTVPWVNFGGPLWPVIRNATGVV